MRRKNPTRRHPKPQRQATIVRLWPREHKELKDFAEERGESMNNVVRLAVRRHLADPPPPPEDMAA